MACIALIAQPLAMATTQLAGVVHHEDTFTLQVESKVDRSPLHMSWVVLTGGESKSRLRMRWASDC